MACTICGDWTSVRIIAVTYIYMCFHLFMDRETTSLGVYCKVGEVGERELAGGQCQGTRRLDHSMLFGKQILRLDTRQRDEK